MRKLLLMTTGGAVGYVLGARAGRPAYDRIVASYGRLTSAIGLDQAGSTVRTATVDLKDAVAERASSTLRDAGEGAASGLHDVADSVRKDSPKESPSTSQHDRATA
jgi:hypothetical protein